MNHDPCPRSRCAGSVPFVAGLSAAGALGIAATVLAQGVPPPSVDMTVIPGTKRVTVQWHEVEPTAGRRVSGVTFVSWDFANSSTVEIVGDYALDCDFRLRISKVPQDPGFNRRLLLVSQLFANTTGTGAPLKVDTLRIVAPDSVHAYRRSFAPNLGIRVSANVNPPGGPLGTSVLTVRGVNTTLAQTAGYFVAAQDSVSDLSQGLRVLVAGPVDVNNIPNPLPPATPRDTLLVTSPAQVFPIMDGMTVSFGPGAAAPGDTAKWTARHLFPPNGRITANLEAFEGYHLWRSDLPDLDAFELLGEIEQCTSKFDFVLLGEDAAAEIDIDLFYDPVGRTFTAVDRDVHDDFPYRYAVSTFDRGFLGNPENLTFEGPLSMSEKLYPAVQARRQDREIYVVPNPFKRSSDFQERGPKVVFANLPTECTIRVYNESAEHLVTLLHGPGEPRSTSPTSREWDLRTASGLPVVPGIYIFYATGTDRSEQPLPGGGTQTVTESVEQTGKFIVVR